MGIIISALPPVPRFVVKKWYGAALQGGKLHNFLLWFPVSTKRKLQSQWGGAGGPSCPLLPPNTRTVECWIVSSSVVSTSGFFNGNYSPMRLVVSLPLLTRENWGMCLNHRSGHNRAEVGVVGCQFLSTARSLNPVSTLMLSQHWTQWGSDPGTQPGPLHIISCHPSGSRRVKDQLWGWVSELQSWLFRV